MLPLFESSSKRSFLFKGEIFANLKDEKIKNHLAEWKNVTSDKSIIDIKENGLKIHLIDTLTSNSKFVFPPWH